MLMRSADCLPSPRHDGSREIISRTSSQGVFCSWKGELNNNSLRFPFVCGQVRESVEVSLSISCTSEKASEINF